MQIFPTPAHVPGQRARKVDPYREYDTPSGLFRVVIILSVIAGAVIGLETAAQFSNSGETRIASLELQEIAP